MKKDEERGKQVALDRDAQKASDYLAHWAQAGMERLGLTQAEFSRRSRVDPSVLSKILSGERANPSFQTVVALADTLGSLPDMAAHPFPTLETEQGEVLRQIPILGYVGVNSHYYPDPRAGHMEKSGWISAPQDSTGESFALVVKTSDFDPVFEEADILVFHSKRQKRSRVDLGRQCLVGFQNSHTILLATVLDDAEARAEALRPLGPLSYVGLAPAERDKHPPPFGKDFDPTWKISWATPLRWVSKAPNRILTFDYQVKTIGAW